MLVTVEMLIREHQYLPVDPRLVDIACLFVGQRLRKIDAPHFSAYVRCQRLDFKRLIQLINHLELGVDVTFANVKHTAVSVGTYLS